MDYKNLTVDAKIKLTTWELACDAGKQPEDISGREQEN